MATDAAPTETTATVLRATAGQVRLRLEGGREVTKRVTVPISRRESVVGETVPVIVTGSGEKARVDLADGWLDAGARAEKAPAKRKRTGGDAEAEPAEAKPMAKRRRSGGSADTAEEESSKKPARKPRATKASPADAPVATAGDEAEAPKRRTRTRTAKQDAPGAADATPEASVQDEAPAHAEAPVQDEAPAQAVAPVQDEATPGTEAPAQTEAPTTDAAAPGEAPSIAEEPRSKRSRGRGRGRGRRADASDAPATDAATVESPATDDTPVVEAPAAAASAPTTLDPGVLRTRIAAAVDLVRAARAA